MVPDKREGLLDLDETARLLNKKPRTVRAMAARGSLPVVRIAGTRALRFRPDSIQRLLEQSEVLSGRR